MEKSDHFLEQSTNIGLMMNSVVNKNNEFEAVIYQEDIKFPRKRNQQTTDWLRRLQTICNS